MPKFDAKMENGNENKKNQHWRLLSQNRLAVIICLKESVSV